MLIIEGGRPQLYQWDVNQRLEVMNSDVLEVHFSNSALSYALVCDVYEENGRRYANIPNIILQYALDIQAHGCCAVRVRDEQTCHVIGRAKPADYVYTETEVKSYENLDARIKELEENGVGGSGGGAVSSVNGKTGKVTLTAEDVGAVSPDELDDAVDLVFNQLSGEITRLNNRLTALMESLGMQIIIITQPQSQVAVGGDTVTFSVEAVGVASYQWQVQVQAASGNWDDLSWEGATTATMTRTLNTTTVTYKYRCKLTAADGTVVYTDVICFAPILITKQPENVTAAVKDWATFKCEAEGEGLTYQWKLQTKTGTTWSSSGATGATTNEVKFEVQSHHDGYKYCCEITDANGNTVTSDIATITLTSA